MVFAANLDLQRRQLANSGRRLDLATYSGQYSPIFIAKIAKMLGV